MKREAKLEKAVKHFMRGEDANTDHGQIIQEVLNDLEDLKEEMTWEDSQMTACVLKIKEMVKRMNSRDDNPLATFPPSKGGSLYCDVLKFGMIHARPLVGLLSGLMVTEERCHTRNDLLALSQAFAQVTSNLNRKTLSTMRKVRMFSLKNLGISNRGLDLLAKFGLCEGETSWLQERTNLSLMDRKIDEDRMEKFCENYSYDNINFEHNNMRNDQTLIVKEFETVDTSHLPSNDGKSFEEICDMITPEEILLTEDSNTDLRMHLENIAVNRTACVIGNRVPGFGYLLKFFPQNYDHPHSQYSNLKSKIHIEVPLNKNEMKTGEHSVIVEVIQDMHLNSVKKKLEKEERDQFDNHIQFCRNYEKEEQDDDEESDDDIIEENDRNLKIAEESIDLKVERTGEAIIWGDQQTGEKQRTATELRRTDATKLEQGAYIRNRTFAGFFHVVMNITIHGIKGHISDIDWVDDKFSINEIRKSLSRSSRTITNNEDKIKTKLQDHKKFFTQIGHQYMVIAFESFIEEDEEVYTNNKQGASRMLKKFLQVKGIQWMWTFDGSFDYFDEAQAVAADVIARTLILDIVDVVVHTGDAKGLHACRLLLIMFFLNTSQEQRSKYAIELLINVVQYRGLSTRVERTVLKKNERTRTKTNI